MPKGKKVKLTKAQKALKKLEAKRKLRRDHLKREVEHGKISLKQLEKKWRQLLLKMRLPDFKQDAELMWHRFERVLDVKDYVISCLLDQFDDAETQYRSNMEAHVEAIDAVIAQLRSRLAELRQDYVRDVRGFAKTASEDATLVANTEQEDETFIRAILYKMNKILGSSDNQSKVEYIAAIGEQHNKNSDVQQYLRSVLESRMDVMWGDFKGFLDDYDGTFGVKHKDYQEHKVHYDATNELIKSQVEKSQRLYRATERCKEQLAAAHENHPLLLADLMYEHKFFGDTFRKLKNRLKAAGRSDREHLRVVTVEGNKALDHMRALAGKGESILQLGAICRRLETQKEKVVPLPRATNFPEDLGEPIRIDATKCPVEMMRAWDRFDVFRHFWVHVGVADAECRGMRQCVDKLREENRELCAMLRGYMDGVAREGYQGVEGPKGPVGPKVSVSGTEHAKHMLK